MDRNVLKNYRPVSNCSFLDKFLERCAYLQINDYLSQNSLYGKYQSAYRVAHSTETALLRIHNDIMLSLDKQKDVLLVMLDLSAAFDTIDHNVLLQRLRLRFGFGGAVLDWIRSFITGRSQQVVIGSMVSSKHTLKYGVPQGSLLGPMLFSLYVAPLEDVIAQHGCKTVIFADDTQLYISCESSDSVSIIEKCVDEIGKWMAVNFLSLNESKTELVCFESRFKRTISMYNHIHVGDSTIVKAHTVRNLGVMFDENATMACQVANICRSTSYSLWRIGKIRHLLDQKTAEALIHALISSKLDYCNSILYGIQGYQLRKLQSIQYSAACMLLQIRKREHLHMTPYLQQLHWLPVAFRIEFKIICIIFKCIYWTVAPFYLKEILEIRVCGRPNLRSSCAIMLKCHPQKTLKNYGDRAISVIGPKLWNDLPDNLRCIDNFNLFKTRLKTHMFLKCYNC